MLLQEITNELQRLRKNVKSIYNIVENEILPLSVMKDGEISIRKLLAISAHGRMLSKIQGQLENEKYISESAQVYVYNFTCAIDYFCTAYDDLTTIYLDDELRQSQPSMEKELLSIFKERVLDLYNQLIIINSACSTLEMAIGETWEPLPDSLEVKCEDIIISSETKGITLGDVSKDVEALDGFLNNICFLIDKDKETSYFLRKVETGSLSVVISCVTTATPIFSFVFFIIKLCQNTEKRALTNKDKRLDLINKNLDMAKKILEIDPQNTEANEIIQKCGLYLLQYLEHNPRGTINGERYDIGTEVLKIEDKKNE